jgi:hypothetical protein
MKEDFCSGISLEAVVMNTIVAAAAHGRMAKPMAVLCFACFWLLPFSPIVAIVAVSLTTGASGWSRNLAVTGAVLCVVYTVVMAFAVIRLYVQIQS